MVNLLEIPTVVRVDLENVIAVGVDDLCSVVPHIPDPLEVPYRASDIEIIRYVTFETTRDAYRLADVSAERHAVEIFSARSVRYSAIDKEAGLKSEI